MDCIDGLTGNRCPWIIVKSAATLLSFLSAYAVFMGPMAGILFCDYWLVKRKRYDVPALYDSKGIYLYKVCQQASCLDSCPN
jgi:NCS1 family nucleobase:cation symporter-1